MSSVGGVFLVYASTHLHPDASTQHHPLHAWHLFSLSCAQGFSELHGDSLHMNPYTHTHLCDDAHSSEASFII